MSTGPYPSAPSAPSPGGGAGPAFEIAGRPVGAGAPCFVIAEVGQAHDGSLGNAHAYIDVAARAGASAIKFQTHIAAAESTRGEPWRVKFSRQDESRYAYWRRMEFSPAQWRGLADHAREAGLVFLSSPFSPEAVRLLANLDLPAWKVASGEVASTPLLEQMASTGRPMLLSTGLCTEEELDAAVALASRHGVPVAIFQCTTSYPTPPERVGLNVLAELRARYGCPVGLSDHSGTVFAGLAASALGADLLEVHIVFSRDCFGPDTPASLTPDELSELVRGVRFIEAALAHPVDKRAASAEVAGLRAVFGKTIVAARDLPAGTQLSPGDLAFKKAGGGMPPAQLGRVLGRALRRPLAADEILTEDYLA